MKILFTGLLIAICMAGCGPSTSISSSWRDPGTQVKMGQFNKVLVAAFVKNPTNRRIAEDNLVKLLNGKGVASYTYVGETSGTNMDEAQLNAKLKADGFDGAVVMRLVDKEKQMDYVPGTGMFPPTYGRFSPYYWGAFGGFYDPGYYQENKIYYVETNIYSLVQDKLIWSGVTNTSNPSKLDKMVTEIADVVTKEMKKQGFLY